MKALHLAITVLTAFILTTCDPSNAEADSTAQNKPVDWTGVWSAEKTFGPTLSGPVTLNRMIINDTESWSARIQGERVSVALISAKDGSKTWKFSFGTEGYFEGHQDTESAEIKGHWFQERGPVQDYPFATPIRLIPAGDGVFTGTIRPFEHKVSLNFPFLASGEPTSLGVVSYRTFLRNPERNLGVFFRATKVTIESGRIDFTNEDREVLATGHVLVPGKRFSLVFPRFGETLDFVRKERRKAPGFYPRRSIDTPAELLRPPELSDGWQTIALHETGLDSQGLTELIQEFSEWNQRS